MAHLCINAHLYHNLFAGVIVCQIAFSSIFWLWFDFKCVSCFSFLSITLFYWEIWVFRQDTYITQIRIISKSLIGHSGLSCH
jgi:hypothetical protein